MACTNLQLIFNTFYLCYGLCLLYARSRLYSLCHIIKFLIQTNSKFNLLSYQFCLTVVQFLKSLTSGAQKYPYPISTIFIKIGHANYQFRSIIIQVKLFRLYDKNRLPSTYRCLLITQLKTTYSNILHTTSNSHLLLVYKFNYFYQNYLLLLKFLNL